MAEVSSKLYLCSVLELEDPPLFERAYQFLPEDRKKKTDKLRAEKDKWLSIGVFLLFLYGMKEWNIFSDQIRIKYSPYGKPYLEGRTDLYFNFSHSGEYAACAVSRQEIGCDVEKITRSRMNIAKRFFHASEYQMLLELETEKEQQEMFYRLWTLKESFIKAAGEGLHIPLNSFQIHLDQEKIYLKEENSLKGKYSFQEFDIHPEYKCAVCTLETEQENQKEIRLEKIQLSKLVNSL